jgi:GrpB-like predicted nucleotidyltransferase (UPF0157 family)
VPHDPNWRIAFHRAQMNVRGMLGRNLLQMHHIGGTAVLGLPARPIIDMLGVVANLDAVDLHGSALAALGYLAHGAQGDDGDRFLTRSDADGASAHTLRLFVFGSASIARYLALRDRLRNDDKTATRFADAKCHAAEVAESVEAYRAAMRSLYAAFGGT